MEKTTKQEALCSLFLHKHYSDDQIKKTQMGKACSTYGKYVDTGFIGET